MDSSVAGIPAGVREAVIQRLEEAPVSLALLFGSYATGEATSGSDVDIAVEYDESVDIADVHLRLVADLARLLGTDAVDVVHLSTVDPRIAVEALEHGQVLVGSTEAASRLRGRLEPARQRREAIVGRRIRDAERRIERRLRRREHG